MDLHMGMFSQVVYDMQAAISALGAFICFWGFTQFAPCLWRVLTAKFLTPMHAHCPRHAVMAMCCLAGIVFAFARMNTIGFLVFGDLAAGLAYISGMLITVVMVALAVWSRDRAHSEVAHDWRTPIPNTPQLRRILAMLLIVVMAFLAVGLLRVGK